MQQRSVNTQRKALKTQLKGKERHLAPALLRAVAGLGERLVLVREAVHIEACGPAMLLLAGDRERI